MGCLFLWQCTSFNLLSKFWFSLFSEHFPRTMWLLNDMSYCLSQNGVLHICVAVLLLTSFVNECFFSHHQTAVENYQSAYKLSNFTINPADKSNCMRFIRNEFVPSIYHTIVLANKAELIHIKSSARWICWRCCDFCGLFAFVYICVAKKWLLKYNPIVSN